MSVIGRVVSEVRQEGPQDIVDGQYMGDVLMECYAGFDTLVKDRELSITCYHCRHLVGLHGSLRW